MRKLVLIMMLLCSGVAHADDGVGIGLFVGSPTGLDLKLGLGYRCNLDIVLGWNTIYHDGRDAYDHVTYLATLGVARGRTVSVPIRLGAGVAIYDNGSFDNGTNVAVRAPLEIGFRFHNAPIELYGEVSLLLTFHRREQQRQHHRRQRRHRLPRRGTVYKYASKPLQPPEIMSSFEGRSTTTQVALRLTDGAHVHRTNLN